MWVLGIELDSCRSSHLLGCLSCPHPDPLKKNPRYEETYDLGQVLKLK